MTITIPKTSLVILMGASGSGKSTFARKHFLPTEIVSSDACRGLVSDDENNQAATKPAFELLHYIVAKRLEANRLTVVDATNVQQASRKGLLKLAHDFHVLPIIVVFKIDERTCQDRNLVRPDRDFGPHVIKHQTRDLMRSLGGLKREGFRQIFTLTSEEEVNSVSVERTRLYNDLTDQTGPFDIIGDVHGCIEELRELLIKLGYTQSGESFVPPADRKAIFVGDLVDRGPDSPGVLRLVKSMCDAGTAFCVPGNHDIKLMRKLKGAEVKIAHGLEKTLDQLASHPPEFGQEMAKWIESLISHFVLDNGKLVVAHAGMKESMQGRGSAAVREFALYGETTGEIDEFGLPIRLKWAEDYRGSAMVVFGHTPAIEADWLNNTCCIDTGCVFGGKLSALRYPEREVVSVPAKAVYAESVRPVGGSQISSQQASDDILDISDVKGRQLVRCENFGSIMIPEENAAAALEVMSRFAADPKWLCYLPPTMSPCETSSLEGFLEHPAEAFRYFEHEGVDRVVVQEKHMGSRAVVCIGRDPGAVLKRFGVKDSLGTILTRTGRRFFDDLTMESAFVDRLSSAMSACGFWDELSTDWAVLDCELMPWSAKAQGLLRQQYAPLAAAGSVSLPLGALCIEQAADRLASDESRQLLEHWRAKSDAVDKYTQSYRRYCWAVTCLDDYKLAPFHIMATNGVVHSGKTHEWHMELIGRLCEADPGILRSTKWRTVDPTSETEVAGATEWWLEHTGSGGEGMVFKPISFVTRGEKGMVQPAVKCRGAEYLRIIYGPEYLFEPNLKRLRKRSLARKRALALREFALGLEGLARFVRKEPLRFVHQCAFGVLSLESEPVDPRL